ncbi:hypothetical protein BC938DRAFT_482517, partial [Jimgerdemannia flammicorona]
LPSVVSGSHAIFFDPHQKYLPSRDSINKPAGLITNFVKGNFEDQFRPYTRLFDFDMAKPFKGTLFRLPLRTQELARESKLRKIFYHPNQIRRLLEEFQSYLGRWNEYLLRERLPKIHLQFLQELKLLVSNEDSLTDDVSFKHYYYYWPQNVEGMFNDYYGKFYGEVMQSGDLFYTRSNRGQWISYQEAVFEDQKLGYSAIEKEVLKLVSNFLIGRSINVVQLPFGILRHLPNRQIITPELVRDNIRNANKAFVEKMEKDVFIAFFEYLLRDNAIAELNGCTILPLMDMSFGTFRREQLPFYIASEEVMAVFPNLSSRFVNPGRISTPIIDKLTSEEATEELNVEIVDHNVFVRLVSEMLRPGDRLVYDRNGTKINDVWLDKLWDYLDATKGINMTAFANIPILPTIGPNGMLVSLNPKLPLLYEDYRKSNINAILTKTGTHLIDKRYSSRLSKTVLGFSATNVLKCIQLASTKAKCSIEELLLPISDIERDTLRTFLQGNDYDLFDSQSDRSSETIEILRQLPIFPAFTSSLKVVYKPAMDCYHLPDDLSVFSVRSGMAILCKDHTDRKFTAEINIPELSVLEHLRDNVLPLLKNTLPVAKIDEYQTFLCKVLSYVEKSPPLCEMLKQHRIIPSNERPNCKLFKASELYDERHPVFAAVFSRAGKFVANIFLGAYKPWTQS